MNPNGNNGGSSDLWDYTVSALQARQTYLVLTENTNLTTTPIKFAPPPFRAGDTSDDQCGCPGWYSGFEGAIGGTPLAGGYFAGGWYVNSGSVDVLPTGVLDPRHSKERIIWISMAMARE